MLRALSFAVALALPATLAFAPPAPAQVEPYDPSAIEVDVELLLLVDVSRSMTPRELEIQRRGYAEALTSDSVIDAIGDGFIGHIAVAYVEWAGRFSQQLVVDWTIIGSQADAQAFADTLSMSFSNGMRRTSISSALTTGAAMFGANKYTGLRRVIDISGDGPNNDGRPVLPARAEVLAQGITINGLPLMTREGIGGQWHLDDLDVYYESCVTGGPGSFVIPVTRWDEFADAVRKKLILEIAGDSALPGSGSGGPPVPGNNAMAPTRATGRYDCLIGEKIWENYRNMLEPL